MKPTAFEYYRPATLAEALDLLGAHQDAKPLAGGQSLVPAMNFRLAAPAALVDLNRIEPLAGITRQPGALRIGAMTRHAAVERSPEVAAQAPLLAEAMPYIGHAQIRNRGTIGGSLAHADPAAELPAVMLALDASLELERAGATRRLAASDFFTGLFSTALEPGELLTAIEIPVLPPRAGWAFAELARRHGDFALAGVAVQLTLDQSNHCRVVRIALLSVGDGPVPARRAMAALDGRSPSEDVIRDAAELAATADITPPSDIHASAEYRRQLVRVLTRRALTRATARAENAS